MRTPDRQIVRRGLAVLAVAVRLQPRPFAVALGGAVLYSTLLVGSAVVLGAITDRVILPAFGTGRPSAAALAVAAALLLAISVGKALGIVLRRIAAASMQYRLQAIFRTRVIRQYQRLPLAWHRRHRTGELLANANADVEAMFAPIAPLPFALGTGVLLVITAGVLIATDPFLAAVGFVVGPAMAALNLRYNALVKPPATRAQQCRADVSELAHESFEGAVVVKALGLASAETERFAVASERLRDEMIATGRLRAIFDPLVESLPMLGVLMVLLVGSWRIGLGALQPGELVRVAYLFTLLGFPLRVIGFLLGELPRSVVGWERVERVLTATERLADGSRPAPGGVGGAHVALNSVAFAHSGRMLLDDISLSAEPGTTLALVGPTGAGKSTLASLLVRLSDPDAGAVLLDGVDLRELSRRSLASQVAIAFQQPFIFDASVRANITLGEPFTDQQVRAAAQLAQADGFVDDLPDGYATVLGERGASLSGGQRQRIALARALVRRPRLLVLDEATSSVDATVERAILQGLRKADLDATIVLITSRASAVASADTVALLVGGRLRAWGRHDDLLTTEPSYAAALTTVDEEGDRR